MNPFAPFDRARRARSSLEAALLAVCIALPWPAMAADAPSTCPFMMSDPAAAARALRTFGALMESARLCKVGQAVIDRQVGETLETYRPCLQQLGMKADVVKAAMQSGVPDARTDYAKIVDQARWCEDVREQYPQ